MSSPNGGSVRYVVICVDDAPKVLAAMARDVAAFCGGSIAVEACSNADAALGLARQLNPDDARVPLIITGQMSSGMSGVDLLLAMHQEPDFRATRKMLASASADLEQVRRALNHGALHRSLPEPWDKTELHRCLRDLLTAYFVHHAPADMARFPKLVDRNQIPRAQRNADLDHRALQLQVETLRRSFLANLDMSDEEVDRAMGAEIDEALNNPERKTYPPGEILLRQGEPVGKVSILVSGDIQLLRSTGDQEVVLHTNSAGRLIGLLSLAHRQRAFYTCRALSKVTVIPLTLEQLDSALRTSPLLSGYLVTALIRSMSNRSKRTAQLKVEVEQLNANLRAERDLLAKTLSKLEHTQTRLVESEKMAQLGQLAAGVAHELNNPIAAIQRAVDFVGEDLLNLLGETPDGETIKAGILSALHREPASTREQRQRRTALVSIVGSDELAQRLVKIGVDTPEKYRSWFGRLSGRKREQRLSALERHYKIGTSLRNLSTCSVRVSGIVDSLRAYARADEAFVAEVDLHEGLENTLLMLGHALGDVEVVKDYGSLPLIECRPGEINQVWTNLISNALHAMNHRGSLHIETDAPSSDKIRVRITDSGCGVSPKHLPHVFELNFTTKQGQVGFGLGMGLAICRQIVNRHGGTIEMESEPGRTCVTVVLPVSYVPVPGEDHAS